MKVSEMRAYLSNLAILETDDVVVRTDDGVAHAIVSIKRENGEVTILPTGVEPISPAVEIQLAQ